MDRIANILAIELRVNESDALKEAACGRISPSPTLLQELRRLRLIDPIHGGLTPLGRDVWQIRQQIRKV